MKNSHKEGWFWALIRNVTLECYEERESTLIFSILEIDEWIDGKLKENKRVLDWQNKVWWREITGNGNKIICTEG